MFNNCILQGICVYASNNEGDPHLPLGTQYIQRFLERYAVRKGLARNTQQSCYIVSRRLISHFKGAFSITKHNNNDIYCQI